MMNDSNILPNNNNSANFIADYEANQQDISSPPSSSSNPTLNEIEEFSNAVVNYANNNNLPCISALALYADEQGIDIQEVPKWISNRLKSTIQEECASDNMFANSYGRLPI